MIAVLGRPAGRTAVLGSALCLALLASGWALAFWRPIVAADLLLFPFLAVACAISAALLRIDNSRWRLEAPFLGATLVALGPWWTLGFAVLGLAAESYIRSGRPSAIWRKGTLALSMACALVALSAHLVDFPGWVEGLIFAVVWIGLAQAIEPRGLPASVMVVATLILTAALGAMAAEGRWVGGIVALAPTGLIASIAMYGDRTESARRETLQALALMLQRAHPYTHSHLERVAAIAEKTALNLGLSPDRSRLIFEAARLHDIGKIAVDELILDKSGALTPDEYEHVKLHAPFGAAILEEIAELREIADWIRHHHERPDGKGYPHGLSGDEIPLEARIIAVADAFDAMTGGFETGEKRPYREPMSAANAMCEMDRCAGTQFDSAVVAAFRVAVEEECAS